VREGVRGKKKVEQTKHLNNIKEIWAVDIILRAGGEK
jgi:hypothetical protein